MIKDTVFHQVLKPITKKLIDECARRFRTDYDCETFKTVDHLKTMIFAHLCEIKSLRSLEVAITDKKLGINKVNRSTLSDANKRRPAQAFIWILEQLMLWLPRKQCKEMREVVRLLDSSPIQLRGYGYDEWTKDHATRHIQGLKLHVEYNLALKAPVGAAISHSNCNDIVMGQSWLIKPKTIYVFDKGYYDFNWWWEIHQKGAFFVTRLKRNVAITMIEQKKATGEVLEDGTFKLKNKNPRGGKVNLYREELRRISIKREGKKPLILVTNRQDLSAEAVGELYKARWDIELFFKWIKQNLKIKKFLGKSMNAVKIQLATALIAYLLILIFKYATKDKRSLYLLLVWVRHHLDVRKRLYRTHSPPEYLFSRGAV